MSMFVFWTVAPTIAMVFITPFLIWVTPHMPVPEGVWNGIIGALFGFMVGLWFHRYLLKVYLTRLEERVGFITA